MITMENRTIRVKVRTPECMPTQAHEGEWYDLISPFRHDLHEGNWGLIDLGVCIEVPEGYEAILAPRSSTFKKYGILQTNGIGVIDHTYCGDNDWWKMAIYATRDAVIPEGARIAQFRIQPIQPHCDLQLVEQMGNEDRGGLGSTGV